MGEIKHSEPERQLSGFGGTLAWRPLVFVKSVPYVYSCTLCGVIAAFPKRLTRCCHVFCPVCFERFVDRQRLCPLDQIPFADSMIETLDSGHGGVNNLQVRCPNATHGCTFVAQVAQLEDHFLHHCERRTVQCPRCGLNIVQRTALSHFLQDCSGVRKVLSATEDGRAYRDVSCSSVLNRKYLSADSVVSSAATKDRKDKARKSASADTARDKTFATAGIRTPSQQKREASDRSSSSSNSGLPSGQSSIIKTSQGTAASTKQDHHDDTRNANPSKIAKGVRKTHSGLSEKELLEKVESMITRAAENATDAASSAETSVSPETTSTGGMSTSSAQVHHNKAPSTEFVSSPSAKHMKHSRKVKARDTMDKQDADEKACAAVSPATGFVFCYITGLVGSDTGLACGEELFLRSDSSKFAGCVLRVHARLRRDANGNVLICFKLCICGGTWRRVAELALSKRINLVLVHPWDQAQNEQLPLCLKPDAMPTRKEKNPLGRWDFWKPTTELKLRELATRGFVSSGALCVAIEME